MVNTLILTQKQELDSSLRQLIANYCPGLGLQSTICSPDMYRQKTQNLEPELVFLELEDHFSKYLEFLTYLKQTHTETILIASRREDLFEAIHYKICGYLLQPIRPDSFLNAVEIAVSRIEEKLRAQTTDALPKQKNILGIPTMDGYEFIPISDIIRCESYLKCTRVITKDRSAIISAYNIGAFIKSLSGHPFFAPHQSHLINLNRVKKYLKEGTIIMSDKACIPVSRRRKNDFLERINCLVGRER